MKEKIMILCYECKKCNRRGYFRSDEEYTTQCKICKNEMQFICKNDYNPKNGLSAIKNTSQRSYKNTKSNTQELIIECPYCHSTNTNKITTKVVNTSFFFIYFSPSCKNYSIFLSNRDFII